jgi:hypothetical protein
MGQEAYSDTRQSFLTSDSMLKVANLPYLVRYSRLTYD